MVLQRKWNGGGVDDNSLQDSLSVTPRFCLFLLRRVKKYTVFLIRYYLIEPVFCQPAVKWLEMVFETCILVINCLLHIFDHTSHQGKAICEIRNTLIQETVAFFPFLSPPPPFISFFSNTKWVRCA